MNLLLTFTIFLVLSLIPVIIAMLRGHKNTFAIFVLCLFFGWSGLGFAVALVWSCTAQDKNEKETEKAAAIKANQPRLYEKDYARYKARLTGTGEIIQDYDDYVISIT